MRRRRTRAAASIAAAAVLAGQTAATPAAAFSQLDGPAACIAQPDADRARANASPGAVCSARRAWRSARTGATSTSPPAAVTLKLSRRSRRMIDRRRRTHAVVTIRESGRHLPAGRRALWVLSERGRG